ncbi:RING finger protein nhl-1-like isoform X2 [Varroa jacobsoni]|uniref:RING finger protein nhl-1 n=1 Tax=Varroa destructor TaxID=109461 RepID=A0A7M7JVA0_VARDE|nr:RING finger protein nhl-1-like isoform X2 [Varroa destructor]XP_022700318.1 RING finger protein nhl-1-like isoform X2 [Varroa jacobsoni]
MSSAWQQLEQLLTCAICMDRFKNPKLLPCQHTYCGDPCMEGLVDYARRQIKCPECRAEHRIPYNGIQTLPTNVTLMRFLELHRSITGEEPEPEEAVLGRCSVCSEKQHLVTCHHCGKKICPDCKEAHLDVMRREIFRICSNVRRSLTRLEDTLKETKKNEDKLITNCTNVREEIADVIGRSVKDLERLKDRLSSEVDSYEETETGTLAKLSEDLEQEFSTINANCEVVEKYIDEDHDWTDTELVEYKEIFIKTLEFLRNFDADTTDYGRRVRLNILTDTEQVHKILTGLLELKIQPSSSVNQSFTPAGQTLPNALMRSQSDHRLASQFKKVDSRSMLDISQRDGASDNEERGQGKTDILRRYGLLGDDDSHGSSRHGGYKSKYVRDLLQEQESMMRPQTATSRFEEDKIKEPEQLLKVFDVDGAARAPLSGIVKIEDSGRFMERVFESQKKAKAKREEKENLKRMQEQQQKLTQIAQQRMQHQMASMRAQQHTQQRGGIPSDQSADSSLAVAGMTNMGGSGNSTGTNASESAARDERPDTRKDGPVSTVTSQSAHEEPSKYSTATLRTPSLDDDRGSDSSSVRSRRTYLEESTTPSRDSPLSRMTSKPDEERNPYRSSSVSDYPSRTASTALTSRRQGYGLRQPSRVQDSESDSESEESEGQPQTGPVGRRFDESSSVSALLSRSQEVRKNMSIADNAPRDQRQRNPSGDYSRRRFSTEISDDLSSRRRSLARSKSSAYVQDEDEDIARPYGSRSYARSSLTSSRSAASGCSYGGIRRSKSSADIGLVGGNDSDEDDRPSASSYRRRSIRNLTDESQSGPTSNILRSRSTHAFKSSFDQDESEDPVDRSSSWATYLRSKYRTGGTGSSFSSTQTDSASRYTGSSSFQRSRSSGYVLGSSTANNSEDDISDSEQEKTINTRRTYSRGSDSTAVGGGYGNPRSAYLQKGECKLSIGKRGSESGSFTWPRSVAVGPDGSLVAADSSNHRVQVFDSNGRFLHAFGKQGSGDGELDNPAGLAVNRIGQIIVSDRYNNRVQIFDSTGRFIRTFGGDGRTDGKFQCPWGLTTDSLGFIYVCDKENHRVQVFQSDGSFVGKMGSVGSRPGYLEHPSYIAVSSTNRVIVSDTNNHRVQVFDVNGRCQFTFGAEGSEEGLFRFPRGVAVDDQGYIVVADSGNNRIQVFQPDGSFIKAFGTWGSEGGKFKGLEDIAVNSKGDIIACDRENHRIQIF